MIEFLITAIVSMSFKLPIDQARLHVEAAVAAARNHHAQLLMSEQEVTELLLGMAYIESRYAPLSLSRRERVENSYRRVTGIWAGDQPPPNAAPSWFCGPLQTGGNVSWDDCQRMRTDLPYAYETGAKELRAWFADPQCRDRKDRLVCALHGYGGGYAMINAGTHKYPGNVLHATQRIRQFAEYAQKRAPQS